jgi:hypothetical protein
MIEGTQKDHGRLTLNSNVAPVNDATKPNAMKIGRRFLARPNDVPTKTGKTGNVHGVTIVSIPANSANKIVIALSNPNLTVRNQLTGSLGYSLGAITGYAEQVTCS